MEGYTQTYYIFDDEGNCMAEILADNSLDAEKQAAAMFPGFYDSDMEVIAHSEF